MPVQEKAQCLRVYVTERQKDGHRALFEAIVLEARQAGIAGASAFRSPMGYGHNWHLHTASFLDFSEDLPVMVEIIDSPEAIGAFLPKLEEMMDGGGMVMTEEVTLMKFPKKGEAKV